MIPTPLSSFAQVIDLRECFFVARQNSLMNLLRRLAVRIAFYVRLELA